MKRHTRLLVGALSMMVAATSLLGVSTASQAQTPTTAAVYRGVAANEQALEYQGVTRAIRYVVQGKDGQSYETNYASTEAWSSNGQNNLAIIDMDEMASDSAVSFVVTLSNTAAAAAPVTATYTLPEGNRRSSANEFPVLAATGTVDVSGNAPLMTANFRAGTSNKILTISGTLGPGESVDVAVPLRLTNMMTLDASRGGYDATYAKVMENSIKVGSQQITHSAYLYARFAHRVTNSVGTDYLATTMPLFGTTRNADGSYTVVPEEIQALMPSLNSDDLVTENVIRAVSHSDFSGPAGRFMSEASDDSALYTGGLYYYRTARLKAALAGTGWSVNSLVHAKIGDTDKVSDIYAYQTWGRVSITNADGTLAVDPANYRDRLYVEVYEYIRTHPVTIYVNDPYAPNDSLDFIRTYAGEEMALDDGRVAVDDSQVDRTTPGRYPVTFTYTPAGGESITKTDYVTVLARQTTPTSDPTTENPAPTPTADPTSRPSEGAVASPKASRTVSARALALTGADSRRMIGAACSLLVVGALVLAVRRRRV